MTSILVNVHVPPPGLTGRRARTGRFLKFRQRTNARKCSPHFCRFARCLRYDKLIRVLVQFVPVPGPVLQIVFGSVLINQPFPQYPDPSLGSDGRRSSQAHPMCARLCRTIRRSRFQLPRAKESCANRQRRRSFSLSLAESCERHDGEAEKSRQAQSGLRQAP
jgi:hypothetical protein